MSCKDILRQLFTERDNETHDIARWLAALSVLVGLGLNTYAVVKGQPFDMQAFGIGCGALFGGLGVALKLKKESGDA
ncbi:MAG: hypothetical protein JSR19_06930 [Proteobacteria bacterium]|nr:hypothetical protein [Pseudomonadota bacterium]HQR02485.1 hypothetical protein [Rhodocyclaceae bacterium]